jgi:hypothetical protein
MSVAPVNRPKTCAASMGVESDDAVEESNSIFFGVFGGVNREFVDRVCVYRGIAFGRHHRGLSCQTGALVTAANAVMTTRKYERML